MQRLARLGREDAWEDAGGVHDLDFYPNPAGVPACVSLSDTPPNVFMLYHTNTVQAQKRKSQQRRKCGRECTCWSLGQCLPRGWMYIPPFYPDSYKRQKPMLMLCSMLPV